MFARPEYQNIRGRLAKMKVLLTVANDYWVTSLEFSLIICTTWISYSNSGFLFEYILTKQTTYFNDGELKDES